MSGRGFLLGSQLPRMNGLRHGATHECGCSSYLSQKQDINEPQSTTRWYVYNENGWRASWRSLALPVLLSTWTSILYLGCAAIKCLVGGDPCTMVMISLAVFAMHTTGGMKVIGFTDGSRLVS